MSDKVTFNELNTHLMVDKKPSVYLKGIEAKGYFAEKYPFTMLSALKTTEQNPKWHPEGNVWNHTLQVVDNAALLRHESDDREVFMWSALLHDIGKPSTTRVRKGKITAYNHDKAGEKLAKEFLEVLTDNSEFILKVSKMVRWHMQVLMVTKNLPFANIKQMVEEVPLQEIALLAICDRLGRGEVTKEMIEKEKKI